MCFIRFGLLRDLYKESQIFYYLAFGDFVYKYGALPIPEVIIIPYAKMLVFGHITKFFYPLLAFLVCSREVTICILVFWFYYIKNIGLYLFCGKWQYSSCFPLVYYLGLYFLDYHGIPFRLFVHLCHKVSKVID